MKIPLSWLKRYVPISSPAADVAHLLTMSGTEIAGVEETGGWDRDKVLVGHVARLEKHPNADRLSLATVDLGNGETATVVCGGPNIAEGQKIAFAREGAMLFSTRSGREERLKAAKIRGVLSAGMVCSEVELGLGEDHTGILVLDDDVPAGTPLADLLGDAILDAEVTPNRPDCLSMLGVAHEVAALTGTQVTEPDASYAENGPPIDTLAKVGIDDPNLCSRYCASVVDGVTVGPSPAWLQASLAKVGQRSINNIVDITNFVMLEYGQPLHAFDFDTIKERAIIVRAARSEEKIETLDDETLDLKPPMLTISDSRDPIALAGVIGGTATAVQDGTTSILLESANFDAVNTRRTARALRQDTEASYRFERGIRADLAPRALRRATKLVLDIGGGEAASGIIDTYPGRRPSPVVKVRLDRVNSVLGADYSAEKIDGVLTALGFARAEEPDGVKEDERILEVPYWRSDIVIEADVVEEVARVLGYDEIPTTMLSSPVPHHEPRPLRALKERVRDVLAGAGMQETIAYSATTKELLDATESDARPLEIANPMSAEHKYMRTSLRGSALQTLASNRRVLQGDGIRLFEIGRAYIPQEEAKERALPHERETLIGVLSGPRSHTSWLADGGQMDFFDAKGVLESLAGQTGLSMEYKPAADPVLHPGKTASLVCGGESVGIVGEVHPEVLGRFGLDDDTVAMFEIDLESLLEAMPASESRYASINRFPDSERDIALVVDASVSSARVKSIIERHKLVKTSTPFDRYVGEGVGAGKVSVAYRIIFQSPRKTLTAEEVDSALAAILRQLRDDVGAELRE